MRIRGGGIEEAILTAVRENYPITLEDLIRVLGMPEGRVRLAVKRMAAAGLLILQPLPDVTYIRPGKGVDFVGVNPKQRRSVKHGRRPGKKKDEKEPLEGYA